MKVDQNQKGRAIGVAGSKGPIAAKGSDAPASTVWPFVWPEICKPSATSHVAKCQFSLRHISAISVGMLVFTRLNPQSRETCLDQFRQPIIRFIRKLPKIN